MCFSFDFESVDLVMMMMTGKLVRLVVGGSLMLNVNDTVCMSHVKQIVELFGIKPVNTTYTISSAYNTYLQNGDLSNS